MNKKITNKQEIDDLIKSSISHIVKSNVIDGLIVNNQLITIVYFTLKKLFIDDCDNVVISAPTGSGKSIISYIISYVSNDIAPKIYDLDYEEREDTNFNSYILTSSIILQKQIQKDIDKFKMENISSLSSSSNYQCVSNPKQFKPFSERSCLGLKRSEIGQNFNCYDICPYLVALDNASNNDIAVLNYAYYLRAVPNVYFPKRFMTVADEAHLLPDIVANLEQHEIRYYEYKKIKDILEFVFNGSNDQLINNYSKLGTFFKNKNKNLNEFESFVNQMNYFIHQASETMDKLKPAELKVNPVLKKMKQSYDVTRKKYREITYLFVSDKIDICDLFWDYESDDNLQFGYKFQIRNMNEHDIIKRRFINNTIKSVFLSATYGKMNEFTKNFEFNKSHNFKLSSTFNFDKSPIILTDSGYLNYSNFDANLPRVINDCIKICNKHHDECGIIHTSTNYIALAIKQYVNDYHQNISKRFLFYTDNKEKEQIVNTLRNAIDNGIKVNYILVGPSLYEGLDLKDDYGRFNILLKAPYLGLTKYVKEKMKRYPEWYFNNALQKVQQAIGRTNRHKNDYSTIYLLDNSLKKIVMELDDTFIKRIQYGKIR